MIPALGTVVAERFRLVRPLGQGGMGTVWLAEHLGLNVPCAVKFIEGQAAQSATARARFEREAKIAAQIRSAHVVQILDHGLCDDTPYIAMEYLEGEDLDHRLRRLSRLSLKETASITTQVARALSKAHAAGLVHRDLKPANIFLVRDDDHEIAKVLDFGIAKDATPKATGGNTQTGSIMGTPAYMSPEQAQGVRGVDHRSDLWSLAVVVFECLTGKPPFQSEAFGDLLLQIMVHPIPVPSHLAPVPRGFDAWWARAVQRDPEARFQSAKELSEALNLALGISVIDIADTRWSVHEIANVATARTSAPTLDMAKLDFDDPSLATLEFAQARTMMAKDDSPLKQPAALSVSPVSQSLPKPTSRGIGRIVAVALVSSLLTGLLVLFLLRDDKDPATLADPAPAISLPTSAFPIVSPASATPNEINDSVQTRQAVDSSALLASTKTSSATPPVPSLSSSTKAIAPASSQPQPANPTSTRTSPAPKPSSSQKKPSPDDFGI